MTATLRTSPRLVAGLVAAPASQTALVVTPHPMTVQGQRMLDVYAAALVPGETLAVFLRRHGVAAGQQWLVCIDGVEVAQDHWHRIRPKHGYLIEARRVPQKDVLRLVAVLALTSFTAGLAAGGVLGFAGGSIGAYLTAGVVYLAGSAVINKLLGPKPLQLANNTNNTTSPTYALSGARNRARAWEPMGLVLGEPYCVPDLAAQPYTYFANGEQYLWQLFHCGINCASVGAIRVGQTSITAYQGVALSYAGFAGGNTGLPALGTSVDTVAGALLDAPSGTGPLVTRTSSANTMLLALDLEGSLYGVKSSNGAYENLACDITLEYRLVGSGSWLPLVGASATVTLNNASTKPLRLTYQRAVAAGQYEVQARKVTANASASNRQNTVQWSTLKSYQMDTGSYAGQARLGVQIQASGQLNGALDEVNLVATAKPMPYWNGSAWATATSRANGLSNPGALILLLARGIYDGAGRLIAGLGWADAQIDIEGLKLFMVFCAAKNFTFDYFLQQPTAIGDLLGAIAAAGMGTISFHPGTLSVVWFSDTDPVESVLNMGTFKAKSFSVDYDTQATAEEIEFQYFDRARGHAWKAVRVLAPGVATPTATGRQQLVGVTTEAQAAVLARFSMAQNVYQRKTVNCEVDLEHMTFRRGTVMAVSHDITQWGYGGRVQAASYVDGIVTLTLDDVVPEASPSGVVTRYVGLRLAGESQYRILPASLVWRNLLDYSQAFDGAFWSRNTITATPNATLAPDGTPTAVLLAATGADSFLTKNVAYTGAEPLAWSIWLRASVPTTINLLLRQYPAGTDMGPTAVAVTTAWQRFVLVGRPAFGQTSVNVFLGGYGSFASGAAVYAWGAQLEENNLLQRPCELDHAAWNKNLLTVTPNATAAPDGSITADLLTSAGTDGYAVQHVAFTEPALVTFSVWLRASVPTTMTLVLRQYPAGTDIAFNLTLAVTTAWQKFVLSGTPAPGVTLLSVYIGGYSGLSSPEAVYAWGAHLGVGNLASAYQPRPAGSRRIAVSWPAGVPVPGSSAANPARDALWIYDFKATPGQKMRVAEISPQGNLEGARIALVPESAEFWTYVWSGAYTAPPNTSLLQGPPVVSGAVVSEQLQRQGNTFYTTLTLTFAASGNYDHAELWGTVGSGQKELLATTRSLRATWQGGLAETWALELRSYSAIHAGGVFSTTYTVVGLALAPPEFDVFTVFVQPDGTRQFNFYYSAPSRQPADWLGAEIRYVPGTVPAPDWATMTPLQDTTTYYTNSPVEINAPLSGTYTFACKSLDTTGNQSAYLVRTVTLPDRRLGNVFDEFFEHQEGWLGVKTGCHVQDSALEANDSTTWATLSATWDAWTRWNVAPASPVYYETPARDFGTVVAGQINASVDADGTLVQELATSSNGTTWSAWGGAAAPFATRYLKLRLTVAASGPAPVPLVRRWSYQVNAPIKFEYINDIAIAALTGAYRIGTGDIRIPLSGVYGVLKRTTVVVQDNSAGTWSFVRLDQSLSPGPRWQFRLNGTLADPAFVDFFVEGY